MKEKYTSVSVRKKENVKGAPWEAILKYKDENGKWKNTRKTLKGVKGKKEAERLAQEFKDEMNLKANLSPHKTKPKAERNALTVNQAVERYLAEQEKTKRLNASTLHINKQFAKNHIYPYFEGQLLTSITRQDIVDWHGELLAKLAPSTVGTAHSLLRKTFFHYARIGTLAFNPFEYVKSPKVPKKEIPYLLEEDRETFELCLKDYKKDSRYRNNQANRCGIWLAYYTGMRASEICGLRWGDVHYALKRLDVKRAVGRDGKRGYIKEPKNRTSERTIYLFPQLIERLKEHEAYVVECLRKDGMDVYEAPRDYYVIGRYGGEQFNRPELLSSFFARFVRQYRIKSSTGEYLKLHDLRHTFATMGVQSGMDIKSLSSILGHANADMTLNTYASSDENATRAAMQQFEKFLED